MSSQILLESMQPASSRHLYRGRCSKLCFVYSSTTYKTSNTSWLHEKSPCLSHIIHSWYILMAPWSNVPSSNKKNYTAELHEFYISLNTSHVEIADFFFCLQHFLIQQWPSLWRWPKPDRNLMVHGVQPGTEAPAHGTISFVDLKSLFIIGKFSL